MANDEEETQETGADENAAAEDEGKSFRERVEELREQRSGEEGEGPSRAERMEEMMGGGPGGPGGPGGMGGNPFAAMMGGMMGGGPGAMGGGPGGGGADADTQRLARELELLRDEVADATRALERIADALED